MGGQAWYFWRGEIFVKDLFLILSKLGPSSSSRGEFYLFFSVSKKEPILVALLSGESAHVTEDVTDDVIKKRAIILLKEIFGSKNVSMTKLRSHAISRWKSNPYVKEGFLEFMWSWVFQFLCENRKKGAYSFMAVGASGDDYDLLAAPVELKDKKTGGVYFAGEHTNRHYPATVHGAYISGLREAGRIADNYCDTPYSLNSKAPK